MPKPRPLSVSELSTLLPRIQATVALLGGRAGTSATTRAQSNGRKSGRTASTRTRAGAAELQEKLLAALRGSKGLALGQVVKKIGASRSAVKYQLRRLRGQKKARVVGDRKEARWFAV